MSISEGTAALPQNNYGILPGQAAAVLWALCPQDAAEATPWWSGQPGAVHPEALSSSWPCVRKADTLDTSDSSVI